MASDPLAEELDRFLRKVLEIQLDDPEKQLTAEELEEIAKRAGLSEEDWKRVSDHLERHLEKGRNFLRCGNFEDAILELDQAAMIAPYRADVLCDCGKAHFGRWKETGKAESKERAEELFRRCLEIDPANAGAAEELSELRKARSKKWRGSRKWLYPAAACAALAIGVAGWLRAPAAIEVAPQIDRTGAALDFLAEYDVLGSDFSTTFENSLEMAFVVVPIFEGTTQVDEIEFSVFETRVKEFREFLGEADPSEVKVSTLSEVAAKLPEDHPMTHMTWQEARAFCDWLTFREREAGMIGPNDRYRLPTDHEWSCAIGIGQVEDPTQPPKRKHNGLRGVFPWGASWPPESSVGNYQGPEANRPDSSPTLPDGYIKSGPTGSFPLTHWGIRDLGGNVWEWCEDSWDVDMAADKTLRGGGFNAHLENHILSAGRRWIENDVRRDFVGFRVVLDRGED